MREREREGVSADVSVPRPRTHDDRTGRVFPDHLITPTDGMYNETTTRSGNHGHTHTRSDTPKRWMAKATHADTHTLEREGGTKVSKKGHTV